MDALEQARAEIDTVDAQLAALFERRMAAVLQVAEYKRAHGLPVYDAARETAVLEKAAARIQDPALRPYYKDHVQNLMDVAKQYEAVVLGQNRAAYQGVEGAFAHIALRALFPHAEAVSYSTWDEVFEAVPSGEAAHGDLGMITSDDIVLGISYSGETQELLMIVPILKREGATLIAMTGNPNSTLAKHADLHINCHVEREACPLNLAPTSSTTVTLALGDALAVACLSAKGFSKEDFARSHPGGALGRRLLIHVRDIMRQGDAVPRVTADIRLLDAIREITAKHIGMTAVVDADDHVIGIFTEGDLRRLIEKVGDVRNLIMRDVMTPNPHTIGPDELAASAVKALEAHQCNQLLVVDADGKLLGALHMHDLMDAKVI